MKTQKSFSEGQVFPVHEFGITVPISPDSTEAETLPGEVIGSAIESVSFFPQSGKVLTEGDKTLVFNWGHIPSSTKEIIETGWLSILTNDYVMLGHRRAKKVHTTKQSDDLMWWSIPLKTLVKYSNSWNDKKAKISVFSGGNKVHRIHVRAAISMNSSPDHSRVTIKTTRVDRVR